MPRPVLAARKPVFHPNPVPFDHPVPRHCQSCGARLSIQYIKEERRRRLYCRKCGKVAYLNPRVVAGAIPVRKGRVVLLRRGIPPREGYWTFPGGYVETGETVASAAVRETREETLIRVSADQVLGVYSYDFSGTVVVVYTATVLSGKGRATPESLEVREFHPSEIPWDNLAFDSTRDALKDWVRKHRKK